MGDVDAMTPESMRAYLDRGLGADARHNARTYEDAAEALRRMDGSNARGQVRLPSRDRGRGG